MNEGRRSVLPKDRLLRLVTGPRQHAGEATYCVPPARPLPVELDLPDMMRVAAQTSESGAIVFWSPDVSHVVLPPFPTSENGTWPGWDLQPLASVFEQPRHIGVLLLRLGGFAIGIFQNEALVSSKVGSRFVKGRHSKGGSSQARFARRRDEQARALYRKTCEVLQAQIGSYAGSLDHFLTGGDRRTLAAFEKECDYVRRLDRVRMRRVLDVGDPKLATLQGLAPRIYESVVLTAPGRAPGPRSWRPRPEGS